MLGVRILRVVLSSRFVELVSPEPRVCHRSRENSGPSLSLSSITLKVHVDH